MEEYHQWKTTFNRRLPLMEDIIQRKTNFDVIQPLMEDNLSWKTTFDGRWPLIEDDLWTITLRGTTFGAKNICSRKIFGLKKIKVHLPSKVVFYHRSSSIKGCPPSKVVFHQRLYSINGLLPDRMEWPHSILIGMEWTPHSDQVEHSNQARLECHFFNKLKKYAASKPYKKFVMVLVYTSFRVQFRLKLNILICACSFLAEFIPDLSKICGLVTKTIKESRYWICHASVERDIECF